MPIYRGKGYPDHPDFEMEEVEGMHVSSCGKFWSNQPFTPESERMFRKGDNKRKWKDLMNGKLKSDKQN